MPQFRSTHRSQLFGFAALILGCSTIAVACAGDSTAPGQAKVAVQLTDAPFPYDSVKSVDVFVVRIDAKKESSDSAEAAADVSADSSSREGGWTTIATPNKVMDIAALRSDTASLGTATLPSGNYESLRMIIDPAQSSITLKNGTTLTVGNGIVFPSAAQTGIKILLGTSGNLAAGDSATLTVDFDLNDSFEMRGSSIERNGLLFKPVIKASIKH